MQVFHLYLFRIWDWTDGRVKGLAGIKFLIIALPIRNVCQPFIFCSSATILWHHVYSGKILFAKKTCPILLRDILRMFIVENPARKK